jgi:hypothetical protein
MEGNCSPGGRTTIVTKVIPSGGRRRKVDKVNVKRQLNTKKGFSIWTELLCRLEMFCQREVFFGMMAPKGTHELLPV